MAKTKPVCCIAVWINVILLLFGIAMVAISGFFLFSPSGKAIVDANALIMQLCITVVVFGVLMIIINSTGIIVVWGKTSDQDDGCCDSCEKLASTTGWFIYLAMQIIMIVFTIVLCCLFTFMLVKNDPKSETCPGINFDVSTSCDLNSCTDGDGNRMEASECPLDFTIMKTTVYPSMTDHKSWDALQDLFTMCGYHCKDNCSLANGNTKDTNKYLFQLTGKYCKKEVGVDVSDSANPAGCDYCNAEYVDSAVAKYGVEKGASKTGLRDSLQFQVFSFGVPATVLLYINLLVQLINVICVAMISCKYKSKRKYVAKTRGGPRGKH